MAAEPDGKADPFKGSIERPFGDRFICQGIEDFFWNSVTAGKVIDGDGAAVYGHTEQQNLKLIGFCIFVDTAFLYVLVTVSFKVNRHFFYFHVFFLSDIKSGGSDK